MTTIPLKYICIYLFIITQITEQINAFGLKEIAINDEMKGVHSTNQLSEQQQQQHNWHKQKQQQEEELLQQQHNKDIDETMISYVSVRGGNNNNQVDANQQKNYHTNNFVESYDKYSDVVVDDDDNDIGDNVNDDVYASEDNNENDNDTTEHNVDTFLRHKRDLSDWLIAPNTRWCGRGNTAEGRYNHLGGASLADKCCRRHDHCKHYITAMSTRYELFNYRPYTLSHCLCDRRFRTCLKMANDEDAITIGKLFFNMVQTQCFILRSEKICQERATNGTCLQETVKQKAYLRSNKRF